MKDSCYQARRECPACGSVSFRFKYRVSAEKYYRDKCNVLHATIIRCQHCGLEFTNPVLSKELTNLQYLDPFSSYNTRICRSTDDAYSSDHTVVLMEIEKRLPVKSKTLDFGCSFGGMVFLCRRSGYDAYGVDLDPIRVSKGKSLGVKDLSVKDVSTLPNAYFHGITAIHILEHINDCNKIVREFNRILMNSGYVFVVVPSAKSIRCRYDYKRYWRVPYQHINGFNFNALCTLFSKNGFKKVPLIANYFSISLTIKEYVSMILTQHLGNYLNFYPTKLFCVFRKVSGAEQS